jgi:NAD(P)H dehydrogenase (quinone)
MSKVLVLYYSSYGHIETVAQAVAEGAREVGAQVDIKRVPEEIARQAHYEVDQAAPIAKVDDLLAYDAIIVGAGTRFGRLSSQMANFLDRARRTVDARRAARQGRRRFCVDCRATRRAGDDAVLDHRQSSTLRHGDRRLGLWPCRSDDARRDYRRLSLRRNDDRWRRRSRRPTANELMGACYQGRKIAETANKLHG